jgi:prephenate dehydrogenase
MSDEILMAGLGTVGTSIALALRHATLAVGLVGYDPDLKLARAAVKAQTVDRLIGQLRQFPPQSDLCILSLPPAELIPALEELAPKLGEGALVIGIGPVQAPVVAWCANHLPQGRAYVGAFLVEGPSAVSGEPEPAPQHDRFSGGVMGLAIPHGTPQSGIDVAAGLARLLGATAFYLEPAELDAACSTTDGLPLLLAAALMNMSSSQAGWRDARRLSGRTFARATDLLADLNAKTTAQSLAASSASLVSKLDAMISELSDWRASLASGDEAATLQRMSQASDAHTAWLHARRKGDWGLEETLVTPPIQGPSILERMFGLGGRRGKKDRT